MDTSPLDASDSEDTCSFSMGASFIWPKVFDDAGRGDVQSMCPGLLDMVA